MGRDLGDCHTSLRYVRNDRYVDFWGCFEIGLIVSQLQIPLEPKV
jgi:hypothetical protein